MIKTCELEAKLSQIKSLCREVLELYNQEGLDSLEEYCNYDENEVQIIASNLQSIGDEIGGAIFDFGYDLHERAMKLDSPDNPHRVKGYEEIDRLQGWQLI
jgi:hypothetical protein